MEFNSYRIFLTIVISAVILVLIIIGIIRLIKYIKKRKENKKAQPNLSQSNSSTNETTEDQNRPSTSVSISISQNVKYQKEILSKDLKINAYCECFLKPVKYELVKIYNDTCPIDLIQFNKSNEISVTKCNHGCLHDCIKSYLIENDNNNEFKCPICFSVLFNLKTKS